LSLQLQTAYILLFNHRGDGIARHRRHPTPARAKSARAGGPGIAVIAVIGKGKNHAKYEGIWVIGTSERRATEKIAKIAAIAKESNLKKQSEIRAEWRVLIGPSVIGRNSRIAGAKFTMKLKGRKTQTESKIGISNWR
jgi:hypothetical protein